MGGESDPQKRILTNKLTNLAGQKVGNTVATKATNELMNEPNLNPSQKKAISAAMTRRLTLIQGPPGTGKTHVSVKLLATFVKKLNLRPLLAASDSNVAVDNIAEGLHNAGVKVVRL